MSTCAISCVDGYYGDSVAHLCVACVSACKKCSSELACSKCQSVNGVGYYHSGTTCIVQCPLGKYGRVTDYTCVTCADGCLSCFGSAISQCHNCTVATTTNKFYLVYGSTICIEVCPDGQYQNVTDFTCMLCSASCLTCVNTATECLSCGLSNIGVNLFKLGSTCLAVCPDGYWQQSTGNTC